MTKVTLLELKAFWKDWYRHTIEFPPMTVLMATSSTVGYSLRTINQQSVEESRATTVFVQPHNIIGKLCRIFLIFGPFIMTMKLKFLINVFF